MYFKPAVHFFPLLLLGPLGPNQNVGMAGNGSAVGSEFPLKCLLCSGCVASSFS